ncbi:MAG: ABC transporter substrate-binding protein [Sporolactobacillus sp.]
MELFESYLAIFSRIAQIDQPKQTTLAQLAQYLRCSERNVKLILHKMVDKGWIEWTAGHGRGHYSTIICRRPQEELLAAHATRFLQDGQITSVTHLLANPKLPIACHRQLQALLSEWLGFHSEVVPSGRREVVRLALSRHLSTLDPLRAAITTEVHFVRQIFDGLVRYDGQTNQIEPQLAHHWSVNETKTEWIFYLRKGVIFHNGKPFQAEDVLYTFDRMRQVDSPCGWYFKYLVQMECGDAYSLRLTFSKPSGFLLHLLASVHSAILPADCPPCETQLVGTGPFKLQRRDEEQLVLKRFDHYHRSPALIDGIELFYIPRGETDVTIRPVQEENQKVETRAYTIDETGCRFVCFNFNCSGPQNQRLFRQAVRELLDSDALVRELKGDRVAPASSFFRKKGWYTPKKGCSLKAAAELLTQSDYQGEELQLYCFDHPGSLEDAHWLQKRASKIGLRFAVYPFAMTDFFNSAIEQDAQLLMTGEVFEEDYLFSFVSMLEDKTTLFRRFLNAEQRQIVDQTAEHLLQCESPEAWWAIIDSFEQKLKNDLVLLFNYHSNQSVQFSETFSGIHLSNYGWPDFRKLWIRPNVAQLFPDPCRKCSQSLR